MTHCIVGCQINYPVRRILMGKYDMKTAYCRAHLQLSTAVECLAQLDGLLLIWSPFGGKPCPAQWCTISEPICDLANEMIHDPTWDQSSMSSCYSDVLPMPYRSSMVGPFADAKELDLNIPRNPISAVDCYIDNLCTICVDLDSNADRCAASVGLAVAVVVVGRLLDSDDPLQRDAPLSLKKLQGEGHQTELKIVLGWELNSRSLTIALSQAKF
jgi:hypothetical protein